MYTAELKQEVKETMQREHLSYAKTAERIEVRHKRVQDWERIYLTYEAEGLALERRG